MNINLFFNTFFMKSSLNLEISSTYLNPFTGNFYDIANHTKYWRPSQCLNCYDSLFFSLFFIYLLFAFAYLLIEWHNLLWHLFLPSKTCQYQFIILKLTWYFMKPLAKLILEQKQIFLDLIFTFLQSITKYLRLILVFMQNSALPEKFSSWFSGIFYYH